ncbi:MAG: hypothetical protein IT435_03650 [Phycisphaerales bacterium]|nr:hypothetical protein [Phycisphaerales bacterium]
MRVEWLYWTIAAVLLAGAGVLVIRALFWDRARGRRRCPKCWYDMSGTDGMRCTECGHKAGSEGRLARTRRHWRWLPLAGLLVLAADSVRRIPDPDKEGWTRFVPTTVMILVPPMSREEWVNVVFLDGTADTALGGAFGKRLRDGKFARWQESLLARRLGFWAGPIAELPNNESVMEVIPIPEMSRQLRRGGLTDRRDIHEIITSFVVPESWASNGGADGFLTPLGDSVVIIQPPENMARVRGFLAITERTPVGPDLVDDPASLAADRQLLTELRNTHFRNQESSNFADLKNALQRRVQMKILGEAPVWDPAGPAMLQRLPPAEGTWIAEARLNQLCKFVVDENPYGVDAEWDLAGDRIVVFDSRSKAPPVIRVYDVHDILYPEGEKEGGRTHSDLLRDVLDIITLMVSPESWADNGGELGICRVMGGRIIIQASRRDHLAIADLLSLLRIRSGFTPWKMSGDSDSEFGQLVAIDIRPLVERAQRCFPLAEAQGNDPDLESWRDETAHEASLVIHRLITAAVQPDAWQDNGGSQGIITSNHCTLLIAGPTQLVAEAVKLATTVLSGPSSPVSALRLQAMNAAGSKLEDVTTLAMRFFDLADVVKAYRVAARLDIVVDEAMSDVRAYIDSHVTQGQWDDPEGRRIFPIFDGLLIRAPRADLEEIARLLAELKADPAKLVGHAESDEAKPATTGAATD